MILVAGLRCEDKEEGSHVVMMRAVAMGKLNEVDLCKRAEEERA